MTLNNSQNGTSVKVTIHAGYVDFAEIKTLDLLSVTPETDNTQQRTGTTVNLAVADTMPKYGNYSGTLTFSVITSEE